MKKYICLIMALAMTFALAVPALASGAPDAGSVDVEADYVPGTVSDPEVYSVTLEWKTTGTIAYNAGDTVYSWNSATLSYNSTVGKGEWDISNAQIVFTVKNRSNRSVDVSFADPKAVGGVSITGNYSKSEIKLGTAATGGYDGTGTEQKDTAVYTITGISGAIDSSGVIASIAVTIDGK